MVKGSFDQDEVLNYAWTPWTHGGENVCCACDRNFKHTWFVDDSSSGLEGVRLDSCPNDHTSWCALCEDCGRHLGVVW